MHAITPPKTACLAGHDSAPDTHTSAALFRGSADCVKVLNVDGHLKLINPGGLIALELESADQLDDALWWSMWPSGSQALAEQAFRAALAGEVCTFRGACPTVRGTDRWWDVTASPIRNDNGTVESVLIVSRDVTELMLATTELELASQRKDEILETVAHELRNPLSAAANAAQLLALKELAPAEVARIALLITRQLGHISRITEDLLDSARVARGELGITAARVDLNNVAQIAAEQLRPTAEKKGQRMHVSLCAGQCEVMADETRLVQAVGNVIANAVRYTPDNGSIDVRVAHAGPFIEISVTDSGIGIAPTRLESVFDRYSRQQAETGRVAAGLGLGLSLVKAIVGLHNGTVSATSEGPGQGSTFTIRLRSSKEQPEGMWLITYQTPEGGHGTLKRQFEREPDKAAAALAVRDALLPRPSSVVSSQADEGALSLRLLQGLGYQIIDIQA